MTDKPKTIQADKGSVAIGLAYNSVIQIINNHGGSMTEEEAAQREQHYLKRLMKDCAGLEWLRLVRKQDENTPAIGLESIYTALMTETMGGNLDAELRRQFKMQLSALDVLNAEKQLVLTGDPGSGKSAFVNYLALCLSGAQLGDEYINLHCLTEPLPDEEGEPQTKKIEVDGDEQQQEVRQQWDHGALIPLRVILRDFSASAHFPSEGDTPDVCQLMNFIKADLQNKEIETYYEVLQARLQAGEVLVMFDGLDEVAQAGERRKRLLECIEGFVNSYSDCRFLVTCRVYAYQQKQWQIPGFAAAKLANFKRGQIIRFIRRWYRHSPEFDSVAAQQRANKLKQAILLRPTLFELASRPLLLSLIAYLHANRHELPDRRAALYERLLELLIDEWEKARFKTEDAEAALQRQQYSLAEFLQIGQDAIRLVLQRLAFRAHAGQDSQHNGTADISAKDLIYELSCVARKEGKQISEWELTEYLRDRVGILYQRGGSSEKDAIYTFPHRSFQEFLAAGYFRRAEDELFDFFEADELELEDETWQELSAHLGRTDPDRWREVIVLLGGINSLKEPGPVWDLMQALCRDVEHDESKQSLVWGLRLAAEVVAESLDFENLNRKHKRIFEKIQQALSEILSTNHLPAVERAAIGRYLSIIGDLRKQVMNVDAMQFCFVPEGDFFMGAGKHDKKVEAWLLEETPSGEYDISYSYWLAQNPVTVAQFKQFEDDTSFELGDSEALPGAVNTPVRWVSQQEAMKFCEWLTGRWRQSGRLPKDWRVTLPNEPEWEKAARGGLRIPQHNIVSSLNEEMLTKSLEYQLIDNPEPQRRYPWGNEISEDRVNFGMNIGSVSTSGVFSAGVSPYGCYDLAGNVWEWMRGEKVDYPFPEIGSEQWRKQKSNEAAVCVLRGGAFDDSQSLVRCAVRIDGGSGDRSLDVGFRVVLSPLL